MKTVRPYFRRIALATGVGLCCILLIRYFTLPRYDLASDFAAQSSHEDLSYAIMIDAGSSGSRVQIYVWTNKSPDPRSLLPIKFLKDPVTGADVFMKIEPGLSTTAKNASTASEYLDPLLQFAAKHIPSNKHSRTPLYVLATAGMRLLEPEMQKLILDNLRTQIPRKYGFMFPAEHARVITGKEEGLYSWIALNYLSGKFDHSINPQNPIAINLEGRKVTTRERTIGMLEMGGASLQLAFEISDKHDLQEIKHRMGLNVDQLKDQLFELQLGCDSHDEDHTYLLFIKTFLGLGANQARNLYLKSLFSSNSTTDPCLNRGNKVNATVDGNTFTLTGTGNFVTCRRRLEKLLSTPCPASGNNTTTSPANSCPFEELSRTRVAFEGTEFYGFSEFYYSLHDVLGLNGDYIYDQVRTAASAYCETDWSVIEKRKLKNLYPQANDDRLGCQCFKSAWVTSILHSGLKMPNGYDSFHTISTIKGNMVQWTLGALLFRTRLIAGMEQKNVLKATMSFSSSPVTIEIFFFFMAVIVISIVIYLRHLNKLLTSPIGKAEIEPLMEVSSIT